MNNDREGAEDVQEFVNGRIRNLHDDDDGFFISNLCFFHNSILAPEPVDVVLNIARTETVEIVTANELKPKDLDLEVIPMTWKFNEFKECVVPQNTPSIPVADMSLAGELAFYDFYFHHHHYHHPRR